MFSKGPQVSSGQSNPGPTPTPGSASTRIPAGTRTSSGTTAGSPCGPARTASRAVHSLTTRCQHGSLGKRGPRHRARGSARGASPATHAEPRLAFVPDAPPAPSLPASSACSAPVPLPPAPLVRLFPKKQEAGFVFTNDQGLQDLRGTTPAAWKRGNVLIRCAALVLGDPEASAETGPRAPRGFSSANPCRTMTFHPTAPREPVLEDSQG